MAKRFVAVVAAAAPVLAVGGVAFAALASHGEISAASQPVAQASASQALRGRSDNFVVLKDFGDVADVADTTAVQPQITPVQIALLQGNGGGGSAGSSQDEQMAADALADAVTTQLATLGPNATQQDVNNAIATVLANNGTADAVVITAALNAVAQKTGNDAVVAAVNVVLTNPASLGAVLTTTQQTAIATATPAQKQAAGAITTQVAASIPATTLSFASNGGGGGGGGNNGGGGQNGSGSSTGSSTASNNGANNGSTNGSPSGSSTVSGGSSSYTG